MNYSEFSEKINPFLVIPNKEQVEHLLEAKNSIHYSGIVGLAKEGMVVVQEPLHGDFETFVYIVDLLVERGAVCKKDFIVTCYQKGLYVEVAIHSTDSFLSVEDFPRKQDEYK